MIKKDVIQVAILGLGTVGTGVYKLIQKQQEELPAKIGTKIKIAKILVRDVKRKRIDLDQEVQLTDNWQDIIQDPNIDIIIEVMGGIEPARTYIIEALHAGKNVVTANKDLVAECGEELFDAAKSVGKDLAFEASVAGGIPIIRPLKQCLLGNEMNEVMGIINGTTNFILTQMSKNKEEFTNALKEAQELGYAEADPTSDIEGLDAARKLAILASIAFKTRITFDDVYVEGITKITSSDIQYAEELGSVIKLLGIAKNTESGVEVRVHPTLIAKDHPLASVNDSFNAVFVRGDAVDEAMFFGRGAGEMPTASAVVGDVLDVARNILHECSGRISCTCYKDLVIKGIQEIESKYYLRLKVADRPGVLASISGVFGNTNVSIAQIVQKHRIEDIAELVVITHKVKEADIRDALTILNGLSIVNEISSVIRVYADQISL